MKNWAFSNVRVNGKVLEWKWRLTHKYHGAVIEKKTNQIFELCGLNPYKENEPEIEWKLGVSFYCFSNPRSFK